MKPINSAWFCQIELTSRCFMSCLYCSRYNRHLRADQRYDMTLEVLGKALDSLKEWPTRIGIIGGEPILHRQFAECCALIQSKFPREKMGLWTSGGKDWPKYKELAEKTFGFIAYNEHSPEQKKVCRHQRLTVAVRDVVKDEQYMNELIDDCWVQRTWCPTISMKGAFFCEVAAAQDLLWDGPGGYPVEPDWWRKTPEQFKDQRDRYCQNCGMCIPMERDLIQCGIEKASPSVYARMREHRNLRINLGEHIEIYDKQMSIDEVEANKLTWYPGNYRGDNHEDHSSPEGRGSTVWRKPHVNIHIMRPEGSPWHEGLRDLIRECLNPGTTMLEIGSFAGESALQFLESGKIDKLYVVDAWRNGLDMSDIHTSMADLAEVERMFDNRVSAFGDRVVKIKGDSLLVHGEITDKSMDFIYVDSCHAYEHLSQELRLYAPKLKAEAILGGHDYSNESYPGIKKAVDEFCGGPDRVFQDTSWIKHIRGRNFPMRVKTELMTMWYNEEFLAPFFLRHYRFVDRIHIFLDADTNDGTRNKIDQASAFHKNIQVHEFKFPDKMDDIIKIGQFNTFYKTVDSDYVLLVDSDEFIFYPPGYLETHPDIVHFTKLWNVYRHHTEQDLNPEQPIERQRRHGVSDFEGWDIYTKPNIVKAKQDFRWALGHHAGYLNGQLVDWQTPHENFPPGVSRMDPLTGAHWSMADPAFVIERRIKGRKDRQSQINLKHGLTTQHHKITEEAIRASLKQHENDPQVFWLTNEEGMELLPWSERRDPGQTGSREAKATPTATHAARLRQVFAETGFSPDAAVAHPRIRPYEALPQYYRHVRPEIIAAVPADAQNILDVGCGAGVLGKALKQQDPHRRVVGIELDDEAFHYAQQSLDAAYHTEVEQFDPPFNPGEFDCIIFADILEHLKDPWNTVREYVAFLRPGGTVVASIPNVRRLTILRDLAEHGNWEYRDEGILDRTHLRFFTRKQFQQLLEGAEIACRRVEYLRGDELRHLKPSSPDRTVRFGKLVLENIADEEFEELCALQLLFIGTYQPKDPARTAASAMSAPTVNSGPADQVLRTGQSAAILVVSIVIPVFNKVEYTRKCMQALEKNTFAGNYELIVVDNASTDGTADFLKSLNGHVTVITNAENSGFTRACNQGARSARGEFVLFLNNDTEPQPGWLEALMDAARSGPKVGIVGSKLIYPDGRLQEAGGIIFSDGSGWNYGRFDDPEKPEYNYVREVDYVSGASLMVRHSLLKTLGYFDEQYSPGYYEDTDICFAARAAGYKVLYTPFSVVVHHEGVSSGTDLSQGMKQYQVVNRAKFVEKWREALQKQYPPSNDNVVKASERNLIGNILVIDPFLPMFDRASGSLRLFTIVSLLRGQGYHLSYIARNGGGQERYVDILRKMGVEVYATDPDVMRTLGYDVSAPRIDLEGMLAARRFDIAYLSFYEIALQYLDRIRLFSPSTKILIDTVDIHFVREKRQAELANDPAALVRAETTKLQELSIYSKADVIITVTEQDWNNVSASLPDKPHFVIPNIHAVHDEAVDIEGRSGIIFVGNFSHLPNIDSVIYFVNKIFPIVRKTLPKVIFTIVGNNPPKEIVDLKSKNIIVTGYVPSTELYLGNARVSVAPLRYGAGMKGKIGEAMALGLPVVTTSIGAEGMGLVHEETAFITDDPKKFARHIIRLCSDNELWRAVSEKGRQFINEHFSPEKVAVLLDQMINVLENISPLELTDEEKTSMAVSGRNLRKDVVSIVILTFNELKYTRECVKSIKKHTPESYEIIFVDNASTDGTVKWLRKISQENPNYKLIENKENLGFAAGNNQGLALANGNYLLLLNNDTVVTEGWLARMLSVFERYSEVGIVGPVSNNVSGPQQVKGASYRSLEEMHHFAKQWSAERMGQSMEFHRVVGFCLLVKREVIDRIGGLDEQFGSGNFEDDDFCLRAAAAGYKARIAQDAFIHHIILIRRIMMLYRCGTAWATATLWLACPGRQRLLSAAVWK